MLERIGCRRTVNWQSLTVEEKDSVVLGGGDGVWSWEVAMEFGLGRW